MTALKGGDDGITEMLRYIKKYVLHDMPVQIEWQTCKEVNWEEKTMVGTEVASELDMFDVALGLGSVCVRPKIGTKCLVGIIENHEGIGFLIYAEEAESIELTANGVKVEIADEIVKLNGESYGMVKAKELQDELNKTKAVVDALVEAVSNTTPVQNDGGLALQSAIKLALSSLKTGDYSNIINEKVKHG